MCLTAVPHSTPDFDHDSGVDRRSGPLPVNRGNSGANDANSDGNSAPNRDLGAVALSERFSTEKGSYIRREVLSRNTPLSKDMSKDTSTNEKEARPRAAAYIRVSSKKQAEEGVSIAAQIEMAKAYATLKNYSLADDDIFIDDGVSAATHLWSRPAGKKLHRHLYDEDIRHLIAAKMDRLFRDVQDLLSTIDELRQMKATLHLLEYNGATLDTSSAMGRFFLTVIGGIAELERGQVSERTKIAMAHMRSHCKVFTGAIYGWDRVGGDLVPNWDEQSYIDYMRDLYFGVGLSGYQVANFMNEYGSSGKLGGKWRSSTVLRTMRYEFHQQREQFKKPDWWKNAPFHDTVPWGTTEFLDLYPELTYHPESSDEDVE